MKAMTLPKYECRPGCRCPLCDETCAAVMKMDPNTYAEYLQTTAAAMLATAPKGPGIIPAQYRAMADYRTEYRTATPPDAPVPAPARETTPLAEVRRMVQAKKAEMAAERKGTAVRNRILAEFAADATYAAEVRRGPYDVALRREVNPDVNPDLYDVLLSITDKPTAELPAPPRPYDEPIRELRERDRMREAHR